MSHPLDVVTIAQTYEPVSAARRRSSKRSTAPGFTAGCGPQRSPPRRSPSPKLPALSRQMFKGVVLETEIQLKFEVWKHLAERLDNRRGGAPCGLTAHPPLRVGVQIWRPRR